MNKDDIDVICKAFPSRSKQLVECKQLLNKKNGYFRAVEDVRAILVKEAKSLERRARVCKVGQFAAMIKIVNDAISSLDIQEAKKAGDELKNLMWRETGGYFRIRLITTLVLGIIDNIIRQYMGVSLPKSFYKYAASAVFFFTRIFSRTHRELVFGLLRVWFRGGKVRSAIAQAYKKMMATKSMRAAINLIENGGVKFKTAGQHLQKKITH